jgi:hypothetical protein
MRWLAVLLLGVALVAAGCGGGDDESAATDETAIEETSTSTSEDTTTDEATTTDDGSTDTTDLSGILADEDCSALIAAGASIAQAFSGATGSDDNSAELEALADKVPDEIQADVQTLAEAYAEYAAKLQDIGIATGATPTADQLQQLQAAIASIDQQEVTAASERLSTWAQQNCSAAGG